MISILGLLFPFSKACALSESGDLTDSEISYLSKQTYTLKIADQEEKLDPQEIMSWLDATTDLVLDKNYSSEIENSTYFQNKDSMNSLLTSSWTNLYHLKKTSTFKLNENKIKSYIEDLARNVQKEPRNASFDIENGKATIISPGTKGLELDTSKSTDVIIKHLTNGDYQKPTISLAYNETDPQISESTIANLKVDTLIGEGISDFRGSPASRIHNIKTGVSRFDGLLIKPGEEFSFVKNLGEVDGEHGYLPELVIKNNKTEPEFGGGICQVSTTMFRVAINAGLKITARRNHAYPVAYYNPQGMDATVYIPSPDLRFINNTPGYILIQSKIEGTKLSFQMYGVDDGRKVEIKGPTILERNPDGSMKTVFYQTVTDKNGNVIVDDTFNSSYESPSKFPHPGETLTTKPDGWSKKQWDQYKNEHGL